MVQVYCPNGGKFKTKWKIFETNYIKQHSSSLDFQEQPLEWSLTLNHVRHKINFYHYSFSQACNT